MTTNVEFWWGAPEVLQAALVTAWTHLPGVFAGGGLLAGSQLTPPMPPTPTTFTGPLSAWPTDSEYHARIAPTEAIEPRLPFVLLDYAGSEPVDAMDCGVDLFVVRIDCWYGVGLDPATYASPAAASLMQMEALKGVEAVHRVLQQFLPGEARALEPDGYGVYHVTLIESEQVNASLGAKDDDGRDTMFAVGYAQVGVHQLQRRPQAA